MPHPTGIALMNVNFTGPDLCECVNREDRWMGLPMASLIYAAPDTDTLSRFRHIAPFAALDQKDRDSLLADARPAVALAGTVFAGDKQRSKSLFVVLEGTVSLFRKLPNGRRCLIEISDGPCLIGEASLFEDRLPPLEAQALNRVVLLELPASTVVRCLRHSPAAQLRMLGYMSARLKRLIAQIADLKLMTGPQRLAHFIILLLERSGDVHSAQLPFEKRTLAALLGMTPESLSRAFRRLGGLGVSTAAGGNLVVADIEQLRKFIETEIVA